MRLVSFVSSFVEMDNVPLSVEETRAEPAQSSVRPCSLTHEGECVSDGDEDDDEE